MARKYVLVGPSASGTGPATAIGLTATAVVRPGVSEILVGSSTTPADQTFQLTLGRFTAAGTSTALTPSPIDPADTPAIGIGGVTHSIEPTYTANQSLLNVSINQRATFRWMADQGYELKCPATAANGIGLVNTLASAAMVLRATLYFVE